MEAIKKNASEKSPGLDGILLEVLKRALVILPEITLLINKCMALGRFPKEWKKGNLIPIPKPDKDETLAKSYRPICLLPLLRKTFERLIIDRASAVIHKKAHESDSQFGFKVGRSTEDAILKLQQVVKESNSNYACANLLDISGAFDNLWWLSLINILRARGCPVNIFRVLKDYLHEREVIIQGTHQECSKKVTKGTPQSSIFGPIAWNLQLDGLLNLIKEEGVGSLCGRCHHRDTRWH
uniref:Reverse transcriptase domain-containing protein n=1 Tax=Trichogramma kaykai TaxID=54128 RepID=A0ABD2W6X5_9HYME